MKKILLTIGLLLTFTFVNGQLAGIISSEDVSIADPYGPEKIADGTFDIGGALWGAGTSWAVGSGVATYDNVANGNLIQQDGNMLSSLATSTTYLISFDINIASGNANFKISNAAIGVDYVAYTNYATGNHSFEFTTPPAIGDAGFGIRAQTSSTTSFTIDNISIKEVL